MKKFISITTFLFIFLSLAGFAHAQVEESGTGSALPADSQPPAREDTTTTETAEDTPTEETEDTDMPSETESVDEGSTEPPMMAPEMMPDPAADMLNETGAINEISSPEISVEPAEEESLFSYRRIVKWGGVLTSILLIIVIMMQENSSGLSSTFGGGGGVYTSKRGVEKVLFRATVFLAILFGVLNFLAMTA